MTHKNGYWLVLGVLLPISGVRASEVQWEDTWAPRGSDVLVDQPPMQSSGSASDYAFLDIVGNPYWQNSADSFTLSSPAMLRRITWWGFYNLDNPPVNEMMRIRLYEPRPSDGLPGNVLFEES